MLRFPPARLSRTMRKSSSDMWVNSGLPAQSPSAQTSGALVSSRSLTLTKAAVGELDAGLVEPDAFGVRNAPGRDEDVAALDRSLAGLRAQGDADAVSGLAAHLDEFGGSMDLHAFVRENAPDFLRGVGILSRHHLRPGLDDRHLGSETAIGLRQFEAGIAAADHDQMRRQDVELERFDMRHRLGGLEAGNVGNGCVRSHIHEHLGADKRARSSVVQAHFERLRRDEAPFAHDQFGAACLVVA